MECVDCRTFKSSWGAPSERRIDGGTNIIWNHGYEVSSSDSEPNINFQIFAIDF